MYTSRAHVTSAIMQNRLRLGLTWRKLAEQIGQDPLRTIAACQGRVLVETETARELVQALQLTDDATFWLTSERIPPLTITRMQQDPYLRSLLEAMDLWAPTFKALATELAGDLEPGPLIEIDFTDASSGKTRLETTFGITSFAIETPPPQDRYKTDAWGTKFQFGAYSTLISSSLLGSRRRFIQDLADPNASVDSLVNELQSLVTEFNEVDRAKRDEILREVLAHSSPTVFDEYRSALLSTAQNSSFIDRMVSHTDLEPVDKLVVGGRFVSDRFQFNAHRGLYNNAFLVPQNSLAAIINAFVAGIRNVEFDVLETSDHVNIVVHDLTTNRLDGSFNDPPIFIEHTPYAELQDLPIGVLDPLAEEPAITESGLRGLMQTVLVLERIADLIPEMTAYLDARNAAPVSMVSILRNSPRLVDRAIVKIYPFTMPGGARDFVTDYAERHGLDYPSARSEIASVRMNALLAMGGVPSQANESVKDADAILGFEIEDLERERSRLPYARGSALGLNSFDGTSIFTDRELAWIEARSWASVQWILGFCSIVNVMVIQQNLTPSLAQVVKDQDRGEFYAMPHSDRVNAAIIDNFNYIFKMIMAHELDIRVMDLDGELVPASEILDEVVFGSSDRFPDFTFAKRRQDGAVAPETIKDYLYRIDGVVYQKDDYAAKKMKSSAAIQKKQREFELLNLPMQYLTTDLPTDLRAMDMGMLGSQGLPKDLTYRASSLVKQKHTPEDIEGYSPPEWTKHLYGNARSQDPQAFDQDLTRIHETKLLLRQTQAAVAAATRAIENPDRVLMDPGLLQDLGLTQPTPAQSVPPTELLESRNRLNTAAATLAADVTRYEKEFEDRWGVRPVVYEGHIEDHDFAPAPRM